jgi:LPS-assembly lipoprotein
MKKVLIPLIVALCLSACGFHLRGIVDIPTWLNNVAVVSKGEHKELVDLLRSQFDGYHIQVNEDAAQADYWIVINYVTLKQQIISIGASTNPRQYQLIMTVEFLLTTPKGNIIKPPRKIFVTRQFTVNNDRILGSNEEEALLVSEMRQEAVVQIINRLSKK